LAAVEEARRAVQALARMAATVLVRRVAGVGAGEQMLGRPPTALGTAAPQLVETAAQGLPEQQVAPEVHLVTQVIMVPMVLAAAALEVITKSVEMVVTGKNGIRPMDQEAVLAEGEEVADQVRREQAEIMVVGAVGAEERQALAVRLRKVSL
jgi:hypothetical protein